ncbi:MAG: hypothetical protein KA447_02690, partial [Pyrinomonadaceae bacterium]|nr:hypothetical protein [Pyrinomonadaceae bacterium]
MEGLFPTLKFGCLMMNLILSLCPNRSTGFSTVLTTVTNWSSLGGIALPAEIEIYVENNSDRFGPVPSP